MISNIKHITESVEGKHAFTRHLFTFESEGKAYKLIFDPDHLEEFASETAETNEVKDWEGFIIENQEWAEEIN